MPTPSNSLSHASAEAKFLLGCIQAESPPQVHLDVAHYDPADINWPRWYEMAARQGMISRLDPGVNSSASSRIPLPVRERMRRSNIRNTGRGLYLTAKLCEILQTLKDRNIAAVPFKGPALSVGLYNDATRRSYIDLDIMVRREEASEAIGVLKNHGFHPEYELGKAREAAYIKNQYDLPFTHLSGNFTLELHWDIAPRYLGCFVDIPSMWERVQMIRIGEEKIPSFAPEDHLMLLCIHAGKHLWRRLSWICDISDLIKRHSGMNWDQIIALAHRARCVKMVALGLWLASDLLNAPLPVEVRTWLRKVPSLAALGREIQSDVFEKAGTEPGPFEYFLAQWKLRDEWRDRVSFSFKFLSTPTIGDMMSLPLPSLLYPLYYAVRPVRLLFKSLPR